jgi:starch phosphorylase
LWHTHERRRERLVAVARERLAEQLTHHGASAAEVAEASEVLHPEVLTIGFARRFATYKRAMLLFSDPDRLARILNDPQRPVQIIFAGKAHPRDNPGKEFIRQIVHLARREDLKRRVIFLEDYDMALSRYMLQGVDVWLNTPQQGKEASGTSGMKAAMNGAINLSTLDGWWVEGYSPQTGWRVGSGEAYDDSQYGNEIEAEALYDLLEQDVTPLFYRHGSDGLPRQWIAKMKASMREIAPVFNTHRMVRQYAEESYFPSYQRFGRLQAEDARLAKELCAWMQRLYSHWGEVRIVSVESDAQDGTPVRSEVAVRARIELGSLTPDDVAVHVYHGPLTPETEMADYSVSTLEAAGSGEGGYLYSGTILVGSSGRYGLALRVTPHHPEVKGTQLPGLAVWSS